MTEELYRIIGIPYESIVENGIQKEVQLDYKASHDESGKDEVINHARRNKIFPTMIECLSLNSRERERTQS